MRVLAGLQYPTYVQLYQVPYTLLVLETIWRICVDHGAERLWPLLSPVAPAHPNQVNWHHPHIMGDDAYTCFGVIGVEGKRIFFSILWGR